MILRRKVKACKIKAHFYRQLSVIMASGADIAEAMEILSGEKMGSNVQKTVAVVSRELKSGRPVNETLQDHPELFSRPLATAISDDDKKDFVPTILGKIAEEQENKVDFMEKFSISIIIPLITLSMAALLYAIMFIFVIPMFQEIFTEFGKDLPLPTLIVITISEFIRSNIILLSLALIGLIIFFIVNRKAFIRTLSALPMVGVFIKNSVASQFLRNLSLMLSMDVSLAQAVKEAASTIVTPLYDERLNTLGSISNFNELRGAMDNTGMFPSFILQVIGLGERASAPGLALEEATKYFQRDVNVSAYKMMACFDLFTMIFTGLLIGFLVISMYLPIFQLAGAIG
ncbi:MAG: type II secretion system F family protein [Desulfobulbaceae bacterium]|nr:type II secretion system F family protein [Desulfobulbaceae bacterium]